MIAAIVLAAGEGSRMGSQKMLLPFAGTTLVGKAAQELIKSRVDRVCVVTGFDAEEVAGAVERLDVTIARNPDPGRGMLSSVRTGIASCPPDTQAFLIALGDQPAISAALVDAIISVYEEAPRPIIVPVYQGRRGHPLLFHQRFRREVMSDFDETGLRGLLWRYPEWVTEWPALDGAILQDIDEPEDYRRALNEEDAQTG